MGQGRMRMRSAIRDRLKPETLAPLVVVALLLTVGVGNLLWGAGVPSAANPARLSPQTDPFPMIPRAAVLHVLPVPASTNESTRLTLASVQGLVNRNGAELYLDFDNETGNASSLLSFLVSRYGASTDAVTLDWVYEHYLPSLRGVVVFEPSRPESVNIATMVAALQDAAIVGPDTAAYLEHRYGLPVVLDYASSNWTATDGVAAYDRAVRELYPQLNADLFAILPPNHAALRDYLIATRTFVFYEPQGVLASPAELAATQRMLAAAPRGVPILGWFDSPTLTEENAFIQLASQYGKPVVGAEDVPNLSVLTSFGRNTVRSQSGPRPAPPLENKTYVVVAVPDGDNLDFVARRMPVLWAERERGTFPVAWSLSPLLADLAPPYLDYYYGSATPDDRFVLGPSGAGYVYPDYFGAGDLRPYLESTSRYANLTGMDVAWLLNAFVASEIPYQGATLSAYVDALHPRGLVLDYDDQAQTQESWMQPGVTTAAPVIRSTQLWTTTDNFLAKVGDAMATWDAGPHFLWITVYTFRFDLHDAAALIGQLSARRGGDLEVVTPEQLFSLMEADFVARAKSQLDSMRTDPFAATFLRPQLDAAQSWIDAPTRSGSALEAYNATLAMRGLQQARLYEAAFALGLVVVAAAMVALASTRGRPRLDVAAMANEGPPLIALVAAFALFMLALRVALASNFWSYQWLLVGVLFAGAGRPLRRFLDRRFPRIALPLVAALDVAFVALGLETNIAFGLAAIGSVAAIDGLLSRRSVRPAAMVAGMSLGIALGFLVTISLLAFLVPAAFLLAGALVLRGPPSETTSTRRSRGTLSRGLLLALPVFALAVASNYSLALRLATPGEPLPFVAAALLAVGSLAGILAERRWVPRRTWEIQLVSLGTAAATLLALSLATGTVITLLLLAACVGSFAAAAEATLRRFGSSGCDVHAVVVSSLTWIPLLWLFFRMPPVVYSLTVVRLPEPVEAVLYAPEFLFALLAAVLAGVVFLRRPRATESRADG